MILAKRLKCYENFEGAMMSSRKRGSIGILLSEATLNKPKGVIPSVVFLGAILSTITTIFNIESAPSGYKFLWLLPLGYGLLFIATKMQRVFFKYPGFSTLNLILVVRYIILPAYCSISGIYYHSFASRTFDLENSLTTFLMVFEMFCIMLTLRILVDKLDVKYQEPDTRCIGFYDTKADVFFIVVIAGVASFFAFPAIRERMNVLIARDITILNLNALASLGFILASNVQRILLLIILTKQYKKKVKGHKVDQWLIYIFVLINISVFWSNSRLTVLAQGAATVLLVNSTRLLSRKSIVIIGIIVLMVIISLTGYRLFDQGSVSGFSRNAALYYTSQEITNNLQAYFGGPHLISIAVRIRESHPGVFGWDTLINEVVGSIMFVRQVFPPSDKQTTVYFNRYFGFLRGNSMILPTLGQSYIYFGIIGAPLFSILFLILVYMGEKGIINSKSLGEKYAFYILTIWLVFFPMQNLNIIVSSIFNVFLPLYLIVFINRKLRLIIRT